MHGVTLIRKRIELLVEDFYKVTGIRIAFISYDQSIWIEYPKEKALFCSLLRRHPEFEEKCHYCDNKAFEISKMSGVLYEYKCHAGLIEAVSPIIHDDKLLGYLMIGQTLDKTPDPELWKSLSLKFENYCIDPNELKKAFMQLKCYNSDVIQSAARIMDISAKYIHSSKIAKLKEPQLIEKIQSFTEQNLSRNVNVNDLSNYLNLSVSHLSHIIKANCCVTIIIS